MQAQNVFSMFDRINLNVKHDVAAKIVALRPAMESLIVKATSQPESVESPSPVDSELMNVIRELSRTNAGRFGVQNKESEG